ncbi:MAG: SLBB domain-containing protein [Candidatus Hydrogenedentota bacterium]
MRGRLKGIATLIFILLITASGYIAEEIEEDGIEEEVSVAKTKIVKEEIIVKPEIEKTYEDYRIGIGDVLEISVYPDETLSSVVTVGFDGKIGIPKVGEFRAQGKTTTEIDAAVTSVLKKYIKRPEVVVAVKEFKSRKVLVFGEVVRPGSFILPPSTRLLEILTQAGLKDEKSDLESITVIHPDGDREILNLRKVIEEGDITQNIILKPDDTLYVPEKPKEEMKIIGVDTDKIVAYEKEPAVKEKEEEKVISYIYVFGEAKKPGKIEYDPAEDIMTVKRALTLAGWYSEKANLESAKVIRANNIQEPVNLNRLIFQADMSQDLILYQGDSLFIPESKEMGIYVLGHIKKPGFYRITKGMTVLQAIALAEHEKWGALLKDTKLVRSWPNRPTVYSINLEKLLFRGDIKQNMELKDGDVIFVPETAISNTLDFWNRLLGPITGGLSTAARIEVLSAPGTPPITGF